MVMHGFAGHRLTAFCYLHQGHHKNLHAMAVKCAYLQQGQPMLRLVYHAPQSSFGKCACVMTIAKWQGIM